MHNSAIFARCACDECSVLDRAHPHEGWQLSLLAGSGDRPEAAPLAIIHPDAAAAVTADVSEPKGRTVETNARGREAGVPCNV